VQIFCLLRLYVNDFRKELSLAECTGFISFIFTTAHLCLNPRLRMHGVLLVLPHTALGPGA
jgi:hypothetical protein